MNARTASPLPAATVPVSVVIPCFACTHTIERAVASVAAQSQRPLEVILVDDASPDDTPVLLQRLEAAYPAGWIKCLALPSNQGAASARNAGWAAARGRYVAFLDADDSWHPDKLALQYALMQSQPALVLTGHGFIQSSGPQAQFPALPAGAVPHLPLRPVRPWQVLLKNPFITPSIMVRADAPLRFVSGQRYMEDHLLLMELALARAPMLRIDLPLACIYKQRYGEAGLSSHMQAMHRAELDNLARLRREGALSALACHLLGGYVRLKFWRRLLLARWQSGRRLNRGVR